MLSKNHNEMKLTIAPDIINTIYSNGICHTSNFTHFIAFKTITLLKHSLFVQTGLLPEFFSLKLFLTLEHFNKGINLPTNNSECNYECANMVNIQLQQNVKIWTLIKYGYKNF